MKQSASTLGRRIAAVEGQRATALQDGTEATCDALPRYGRRRVPETTTGTPGMEYRDAYRRFFGSDR